MAGPAPKPELFRSLARLVRGLSALFWGLPITLVVSVQGDIYHWFHPVGFLLPVLANGQLLFGLLELGGFQRQERVWRNALERAQVLAVTNLGLSPFLFFWNRLPNQPFFAEVVGALMVSGVFFLIQLNTVLRRLVAMLPDETLREETGLFTVLNRNLLALVLLLLLLSFAWTHFDAIPPVVKATLAGLEANRYFLILFLALLPLAMTMTMTWKIKEAILDSAFHRES